MIPDEAVEAAAKYLTEKFNWNGELVPATAREVLEAAAPHLMAAAWGEGYGAGWNDCLLELENGGAKMSANPYRKEQA